MLEYIRLRLTFKAVTEVTLPRFIGATLQALLRTSLHKAYCTQTGVRCHECPVDSSCGFLRLTGNRSGTGDQTVLPYVLNAPPVDHPWLNRGDKFSFGLTLFGEAIDHLHRILAALTYWKLYDVGRSPLFVDQSMFERFGQPCKWPPEIKHRGTIDLDSAHVRTDGRWRPLSFDGRYFSRPSRQRIDPFAENGHGTRRVRIRFLTPLRAFKNKRVLMTASEFAPYNFFGLLGGRIKKLCDNWGQPFCKEHPEYKRAKAAAGNAPPPDKSMLTDIKVKRFKRPFKTYKHFDGLFGEVSLEDVPDILVSYIKAGEITHGGKFAAMGYGQYSASIFD